MLNYFQISPFISNIVEQYFTKERAYQLSWFCNNPLNLFLSCFAKIPPVLLQSFLVMNDAQLILILTKLIPILTKLISHIFLSDIWCYTSVAVIPSRDDFLSILGYPLCPSISLLGHIFHQIILPLENIIVTTDAYEQDFPRVGISRYVFCELWSWGPGSLCQKASKLKRCCLKQVIKGGVFRKHSIQSLTSIWPCSLWCSL